MPFGRIGATSTKVSCCHSKKLARFCPTSKIFVRPSPSCRGAVRRAHASGQKEVLGVEEERDYRERQLQTTRREKEVSQSEEEHHHGAVGC